MTNYIYKDTKGFMWIGTKYGLNRYDGYNFLQYTKEQNGLKDNDIHSIIEDDTKNLWLLSARTPYSKLNIFNPKTEQTIPLDSYFKEKLPFKHDELRYIKIVDPKKRIWLYTKQGEIYLYQKKTFKKIFQKEDFIARVLTIDNEDNIWIGGDRTILCLNQTGEILEQINLKNKISGLWFSKNDTMWITTSKVNKAALVASLVWFRNKNSSNLELFNFIKENQVVELKDITRRPDGFWYCNIDDRLQLFDSQGQHQFDFHNLLDKRMKTGFTNYLHTENYTWLTTPIGVIKTSVKANPFNIIHKRNRLSDCRGITEDENGNIYFLNRKLFQWNPNNKQLKEYPNTSGGLTLLYHDSLVWAGIINQQTMGAELDLRTNRRQFYQSDEFNNPNTLLATKDAGIYFVGQDNGISLLDLNQKKIFPFEKYNNFELLKSFKVWHLHKNDKGIWIASNNGIFLMTEEEGIIHHFNKAKGDLPFDQIRHIYEDSTNVFWLATIGGGIIRWQASLDKETPSKSIQLTTKNGLSHNYTYAIYGDHYNHLWISSDGGLMQMNKSDYQIKNYTTKDGLLHNEFNFTSHYQAKDSTLYFGGLGGLIAFHPKDFAKQSRNQTPLIFTKYNLLEEEEKKLTDKTNELIQSNKITLNPTDKLIELKFALLDFDTPENHSYAYKIEGYMDNWVYINENFIQITYLPYGDYVLKIKGKNNRNIWSEQELSLDIQVLKPFYLQWWFFVIIIGLLSGIIYFAIKNRIKKLERTQKLLEEEVLKRTETIQKQSEALKALDIAKTRFFSNITHEFRTPLTLIIGPIKQIIDNKLPPKIFKRRMNSVLKNAEHLLELINQMLDISKIESGQMTVDIIHGDIVSYTKDLINRFEPLVKKKDQQLVFLCNQNQWKINFDKEKWDKIIYNLLSNSIKFTPNEKTIQVSLIKTKRKGKEAIRLDVKDTGIGIKEEDVANIFDRFYQVNNTLTRTKSGTGIGLALVKELIELQKGEITISSELNKGTTFKVYLPVSTSKSTKSMAEYSSPSISFPSLSIPDKTESVLDMPLVNGHKKLELLIIEDNDEMREFIRYSIDPKKYNITEARDGEEGIQKAMSIIPDLIISDVMMPKKSGFEVIEAIRGHISSSHIPIILLTAKASLESRLKGLERGADAYLTKPFSPQELLVRIHKLVELRQVLQQRYQGNNPLGEANVFQQEDAFIVELRNFILEHIDNTKLNGDYIGQHFGISRSHLHRKLKALTDQSISEFVKKIRLQKALSLLQAGELNISEITYRTGFSSISYFSRTFKQAYGKAPSEM